MNHISAAWITCAVWMTCAAWIAWSRHESCVYGVNRMWSLNPWNACVQRAIALNLAALFDLHVHNWNGMWNKAVAFWINSFKFFIPAELVQNLNWFVFKGIREVGLQSYHESLLARNAANRAGRQLGHPRGSISVGLFINKMGHWPSASQVIFCSYIFICCS